jgi:hypothetical protein
MIDIWIIVGSYCSHRGTVIFQDKVLSYISSRLLNICRRSSSRMMNCSFPGVKNHNEFSRRRIMDRQDRCSARLVEDHRFK